MYCLCTIPILLLDISSGDGKIHTSRICYVLYEGAAFSALQVVLDYETQSIFCIYSFFVARFSLGSGGLGGIVAVVIRRQVDETCRMLMLIVNYLMSNVVFTCLSTV